MKHSLFLAPVAVALGVVASSTVFAQTTTIKVGAVNIDPQSTASNVAGPLTPADALSAKVKPQSTVFFSIARDFGPNWEVELALGVPPKHDVTLVVVNPKAVPGSVAALDGQLIQKVTQSAPTAFLNYKFMDASSALRPFVGLGFNFTQFPTTESTPVNDAVNGGPTTVKLSNAAALVVQAGATYKLGGPWSVTGVYSTTKVATRATTNTLGIERTVDFTFKPQVFTLALGYSF